MIEPVEPPPVEPLPDAAWHRIERGMWSRLDREAPTPAPRPRRLALWVAAPLVAIAACLALWLGLASHRERGEHGVGPSPARMVAGATPSTIAFGDAHITLDANTALSMEREDSQPTATLEYGAAWFSVAPRGPRPPFEVRAGGAVIRVIGTRFRVARAAEHVEVAVDHGIVEVRYDDALVTLRANQGWSSTTPSEVLAAAAPAEPTLDAGVASAPPPVAPTSTAPPPHHAAAPPAPSGDADQSRYDALQRLEASRPPVALAGYLELSKHASTWAPVALFAACRLAVERHDARARALLADYLDRFPRGTNAADAHELLNRLDGGAR